MRISSVSAVSITAPAPALPWLPVERAADLPHAGTHRLLAAMRSARSTSRDNNRSSLNAKLARDLKRGRRDAIDRIYDEYGATTYGFLRSMLRDDHAAEDIQQQVYLEAWQKSHSYDPSRGSLLSWLLAIARSRGIDHFRRRTPEPLDPTNPTSGAEQQTDGELDDLMEQWRVSNMLSRIPRDEAEMLRLRFYDDLSQRQIAERTGVPLGTVKLRMVSGLARLRGHLEEEGGAR